MVKKLSKQRRIENKTNYNKRLILLKSNLPRLVVRKTNRYLILQIIETDNAKDKVVYSVNTKELLKYNWSKDKKGSLKSISAAYLGGFLLGKKAKDLNKKIILDSGLIPNTKGSRVYSVLKGIIDSGINISYGKDIIPKEDRIFKENSNVKDILEIIKGENKK